MTNGSETTAGFLLRSVDYGESDRILTFFTADLGKISAYARGARKSQKRFGGALEPFALIELTVAPGRGKGMWRLVEATQKAPNEGMSRDLKRLEVGSELLMLIRESIPVQAPDPDLFVFMQEILGAMGRAEGETLTKLAVAAELRLFSLLGMAVGIAACSSCGRKVPSGKPVLFHPGRGGVVCTPCGGGPIRLEARSVEAMRRLAELSLDAVADVVLGDTEIAEIRGAVQGFVEHHLTYLKRS